MTLETAIKDDVLARDVPQVHGAVSTFPLDDELVLYDGRDGQSYVLNPTAALVWELCDGTHSVEGIAERLADRYKLPPDQTLGDVTDLLNDFRRVSLLRLT